MKTQGTIKWAKENGIFEKSDALKQLGKTQEELSELRDEVFKIKTLREMGYRTDYAEEDAKMELGDLLVTLILVAEMMGTTVEECHQRALKKIQGRSGRMIKGVFVKDADLKTDTLDENGAVVIGGADLV